jgi:putative endonuclease
MVKTEKRRIGDIGENLACKFLEKRGLKIEERNYLKKWGEIDIVAINKGNNKIHFVEVKTVSCDGIRSKISFKMDNYQLGNNIHLWKLQRLSRVFRTYLLDKKIYDDREWQFDIIVVFLDLKDNISRIKYFEDIIV